jgi:hypothetical protein
VNSWKFSTHDLVKKSFPSRRRFPSFPIMILPQSLRPPILGAALFLGGALGWAVGNYKSSTASSAAIDPLPQNSSSTARQLTEKSLAVSKSPDNLSDLLAVPGDSLYARLALWLLDADTEDIAAFWENYQSRENRDRSDDITELIFIAWTRLDPQGAIAAVADTPDATRPWQAWACHDPDAALASARNSDDSHLYSVLRGIGEFHPDWVYEHIDELPGYLHLHLLHGFSKWPQTEDPEKVIRLRDSVHMMASDSAGPNPGDLLSLARQDPQKLVELRDELSDTNFQNAMEDFLLTLETRDPALLSKIADQLASPVERIDLKLNAQRHLARQDPAAALQAYRDETNPIAKRKQRDILGAVLVKENPDAAFELLADWASADRRDSELTLENEDGRNLFHAEIESSESLFLDELIIEDPRRTAATFRQNSASPTGEASDASDLEQEFTKRWAKLDLEGYSDWVVENKDSPNYAPLTETLVHELSRLREYEAAVQWLDTLPPDSSYQKNPARFYQNWLKTNPDAALYWRNSDSFRGDPADFPLPESEAPAP